MKLQKLVSAPFGLRYRPGDSRDSPALILELETDDGPVKVVLDPAPPSGSVVAFLRALAASVGLPRRQGTKLCWCGANSERYATTASGSALHIPACSLSHAEVDALEVSHARISFGGEISPEVTSVAGYAQWRRNHGSDPEARL